MKKKIEIEIPEGKTNLVAVDKVDNRPVTERIKTFEDAVMATGMKLPLDDNQLSCLPKDVVAYMKLRIIAAALNELTEDTLDEFPKFTTVEYRWYPWFLLYTQEKINRMDEEKKKSLWRFRVYPINGSNCCLSYANSNFYWSYSYSNVSARLAVKSEELAKYFGNQFIDIWEDYLIGKS